MNNLSEHHCDHSQNEALHDCYILGIISDTMMEHKAEIIVQCYSCKARFKVILDGIFSMCVHDFWEGNIIDDMSQYEWPNMPAEWLADVLHTNDTKDLIGKLAPDLDRIRDQKMILLHITPSYGCEIFALCKSIMVQELADD
ncbi:MAG: hypothetical protein ABFD64_10640 [Armatimonadota bacterium]